MAKDQVTIRNRIVGVVLSFSVVGGLLWIAHTRTVQLDPHLAFIHNSELPTVIVNREGDVLAWNKAAELDTGYSFEEIQQLDEGVWPIIPPEMREDHRRERRAAFNDDARFGKLSVVECDRMHKSGGRRRIVMTVVLARGKYDDYARVTWVRKSLVEESREPTSIKSVTPSRYRYAAVQADAHALVPAAEPQEQ